MILLITGAKGFAGSHLVKHLKRHSKHSFILNSREDCDLSNYSKVEQLLDRSKPDQVYHLAGSLTNDYDIDYQNNVLSTKNLLQAIQKIGVKCRVLLVGSAAEYGYIEEKDNPVSEKHPLNPVSLYGLSKVYQSHLMQFYCHVHQLDIVMARPFNLMGQEISRKLFVGRVYEQIETYQKGEIDKIVLGNLGHKRDYIHVEEAVQSFELIMNRGDTGEIYNVGRGKSIKIMDLLEKMLKEHDLKLDIIEKTKLPLRDKIDIVDIYADITKLEKLKDND